MSEGYWNPKYDNIKDESVANKITDSARVLKSSSKAHVFCQRAVQDLTGSIISVNGKMNEETIDAINFAIQSGLSKQLKMTIAHYTVNYVQINVRPSEYSKYLKRLFK